MLANRVSEHAFLDAQAERVDRCEARGSDPCASKPAPAHCKLSCRNLWKVFGNEHEARALIEHGAPEERPLQLRTRRMVPAVCDVSFDVMTGEIFVIMGLSGSGKSTVMRCLSRLVEPTSGTIELDGQ